ncbi:MAG: DUF2284 domain-containing protein [Clostridia bacterium]|nr:DUF2284 domain-containing protein [Clostridia bacterium]
MDRDSLHELSELAVSLGAFKASVIPVSDVETDVYFRELCRKNVCGNYGNNWMCPPDAGDIDELIRQLNSYEYMLVYQSVGEIEDSYDFEGMMTAAAAHRDLMERVRGAVDLRDDIPRLLYLGAGGCSVCKACAKKTGEPCRHPERATASLETYGVNVSRLAAAAGMNYINGQNTVTYFAAVVFDV